MVAIELFHTLKKRSTRKKGSISVKLDMSKAYDRFEWDFLEDVLLWMGFGANRIS